MPCVIGMLRAYPIQSETLAQCNVTEIRDNTEERGNHAQCFVFESLFGALEGWAVW